MYLKQCIKNPIITLLLISAALLSSACGYRQPSAEAMQQSTVTESHPLNGKIIAVATGLPLSYTELLGQLKSHRFILLGEKHDNPEHHLRELQLLKDLQNGSDTRVVLEMLDDIQANNINQLTENSSDEEIKTTLNWHDRSWPWQDYGPLINAALKDHNQLKAGNVSQPMMLQIYQNKVPPQVRLSTVSAIPATIKATIQQQVYDSHCQMIPLDQMGPMTQIQLSRDASMAYALEHELGENSQAILIAGAFHVRKDSGVPLHLQHRTAAASLSILLAETDTDLITIEDAIAPYLEMADYIWFTSQVAEQDYCASLQQQSHQQNDN
ncbi:ChaN family lipoprotein [Amphritea sp. 1_MG-2023]|uniref:ChaN family lipoprotein n=1 Tax=Amphritea sp. 1_MG-2023 TaxID=3062670 RepID=UPI0026E24867|nr:ChaN family lipoprotein [Amphritea sp. 1_MG-2023]MDO6563810.1 ChaN family lipoprotein [Amphritea sp. 1_MG-2023]